jgi:hypothetical protein
MGTSPRIAQQVAELQSLEKSWRRYLKATRTLQRELNARPADACSLHDLITIHSCLSRQLVEELNLGRATANRLKRLAKELQDGSRAQCHNSDGD